MANRILKNDYWEKRIRDKMGVDDAYLPDDLLNSPDIITLAEANIIEQIPDYATLTGDLRVYLEYVVVLECCILYVLLWVQDCLKRNRSAWKL